ncbi:MAG: hypothetical protein E7218_06800 [Anaerofustis stercorihominis]|nr:hypothetical protein [Anaerofustis stercorihominis]
MNKSNYSPDSMKEFLEEPFKKGSVMKFLMMLGVSILADAVIFAFMFVISFIIGNIFDFSGNFPGLASVLTALCTLGGYCLLKLLIFADRKLFGATDSGTKSADANVNIFDILMFFRYVIVYLIVAGVHFLIFGVMDSTIYRGTILLNGFILENPSLLAALFMLRPVTRGNELLRKRIKTVLMFLFWIVTVIAWGPILPILI